jgi:methylmalonyl-CoA mutase
MTDDPDLPLAAEFPAATREQWLKLVDGVLKGAPFEKLTAKTQDGLRIAPLHGRSADARPVPGRPASQPWHVMQRIDHPDPATANQQALHDLENGATGLTLVFAGSLNANGYGLPGGADAIARVLDGVHLDAGIRIDLNVSPETREAARHVAELVKRRNITPEFVAFTASINPLGGMAAAGDSKTPWNTLAGSFAGLVHGLAEQGLRGPFAVADGRIIHNAGGSEAQELAFALASAVDYLRALEAGGIAPEAGRRMIYFRLAADADQFLTLAKFRAVRTLWARVEEACGLAPAPAFVAAETAWRMMTRRDPWVNLLRTTMAVFAAGLGGADSIAVLPFTAALGLPDAFARRLARNTQLILLEESHLAKVADPAAGSGGLEDITEQLCAAAWALFQEIEAEGGTAAALEAGLIQRKVAAVRAARESAIAHRRDAITGTSEFPDLRELPVSVLDVPPAEAPPPGASRFAPLRRIRLAEPFESLRDRSDTHLANTGARPQVFLANLGKLSEFTPRATFARNFFEAGGIEAITNEGFAGTDDLVAALRRSNARLACLCGSDEVYAREALAVAPALKSAGAEVFLAGRPKDAESYRAAGISTFIHVGCDALAILRMAHEQTTRAASER